MKKIITPLIFIIFLCGYLYYHYHSKKPFRCDSQIIAHIDHGNGNVEINLYAYIIVSFRSEGVITLSGTLRQEEKEYLVNRVIYFTTQKSELDGVNKTTMTREEKGTNDEVPELIWHKYVPIRSIGLEFNSELKALNKNAIFIQELSNPLFVCTKID